MLEIFDIKFLIKIIYYIPVKLINQMYQFIYNAERLANKYIIIMSYQIQRYKSRIIFKLKDDILNHETS